MADVFGAIGAFPISSFSISGPQLGGVILEASFSEGFTLGDNVTVRATFAEAIADGFVLGDTFSGVMNFNESITEGTTLGDSWVGNTALASAISESLLLGDSYNSVLAATASLVEGMILGDTHLSSVILTPSIQEGLVLGDSHSSVLVALASMTEGLELGDTFDASTVLAEAISEGIRLGEDISGLMALVGLLTQGMDLGNSFNTTLQLAAQLANGIDLGDSYSAANVKFANLQEGFKASDTFAVQTLLFASILEGLRNGDTWAETLLLNVTMTEGVTLGEALSGTVAGNIITAALNEGTLAGDMFASILATFGSTVEGVKLGDLLGETLAALSGQTEGIGTGDDFGATMIRRATINEQIVFSDAFSVSLLAFNLVISGIFYICRSLAGSRCITKQSPSVFSITQEQIDEFAVQNEQSAILSVKQSDLHTGLISGTPTPPSGPAITGLYGWYDFENSIEPSYGEEAEALTNFLYTPTYAAGVVGTAFVKEPGVGGNLWQRPHPPDSTWLGDGTSSFTIAGWWKLNIHAPTDGGFDEYFSELIRYGIPVRPTIRILTTNRPGVYEYIRFITTRESDQQRFETDSTITPTFPDTSWYFIVIGFDAENQRPFISVNNETIVNGDTGLDQIFYSYPDSMALPSTDVQSSKEVGMDSYTIWTRVLTQAEIGILYNSGNGLSYSDFEAL